MDTLQLPELLTYILGALQFLLRCLLHVLVGHQRTEHDEFQQHPVDALGLADNLRHRILHDHHPPDSTTLVTAPFLPAANLRLLY